MRLKKIISNFKPDILRIGRYQIAKVTHLRAVNDLIDVKLDGIIVENENLLKKILLDDQLYLIPVFFIGNTQRQCDGIIEDENDPSIKRKLDVLNPSIETFAELPLPSENDKRLLSKLLRYLISRKTSLHAINSRRSSIGYSFPLIEDLSLEGDPLQIIKHLNQYTAEGYFTSRPIDKINICYDCHSSYLNFSECCTKCNSLNLKSEQLVHHFRCAYVGPLSDFSREQKLICPKCNHQLKHIGIDYDKPSEIHTCRSCNHSSQETKMKAKCVDCGKENELEQLATYEIYDYKPTEKAETYSNQWKDKPSFGEIQSTIDTTCINMGAFNLIRSHEGRKLRQTNFDTFSAVISVDILLLNQLNNGMQISLIEELATIVRPYLKESDLLAIDEHKHLHALLIDYETNEATEVIDILHFNLNKMLRDNGWCQKNVISITLDSVHL